MNCDTCERKEQCFKENRLLVFTTLDDWYVLPELGMNAHAIIGIGQTCPKGE